MKFTDIQNEASPTATGPQGRMLYNKLKSKEELAKERTPVYDKSGKVTGFKKIKKTKKVKEAGPIATDTRGRSNTSGMPLSKKPVKIPLNKAFTSDEKLERNRRILVNTFKEKLEELITDSRIEARQVGGEFISPGIIQDLEKILKNTTFRYLK